MFHVSHVRPLIHSEFPDKDGEPCIHGCCIGITTDLWIRSASPMQAPWHVPPPEVGKTPLTSSLGDPLSPGEAVGIGLHPLPGSGGTPDCLHFFFASGKTGGGGAVWQLSGTRRVLIDNTGRILPCSHLFFPPGALPAIIMWCPLLRWCLSIGALQHLGPVLRCFFFLAPIKSSPFFSGL